MRFARSVVFPLLMLTGSVFISGCVQRPPAPQRTQLEIRQFQTREYESKSMKVVMKALINALQDDGFMVKNADKELGFISAAKETDVEDHGAAMMAQIFAGQQARYQKNSIVEASVNVSELGNLIKVRAVFQTKVIDNWGSPVTTYQVEDPAFYQEFFAKVDKSIFIEKQKF